MHRFFFFVFFLLTYFSPAFCLNGSFNQNFAKQLANYNVAVGCVASQVVKWNCYPCLFTPKLKDVVLFQGKSGDSAGYVGFSQAYNATILVFRGTRSFTNILVDIIMKYKNYQRCDRDGYKCKVHSGFHHAYLEIQSAVHQQIANRTIHYGNRLIVTGLSLGGALAILSSAHLMSLGYNITELYTFGCPRVGNKDFHSWFKFKYGNRFIARIVHHNDPVPHVPKGKGYTHIGTEVLLNKDSSSYKICKWEIEDKQCSMRFSLLTTNVSMHTTYWNTSVFDMVKQCT